MVRIAQKIFCFGAVVFAANLFFPLGTFGQQGGGQQITSGDFSFAHIPDDAIFSVVEASDQEQAVVWSYVTSPSGLPSDYRNLLAVEDLRDYGGFRIDVELVSYQHQITGLPLDLQEGTNGGTALMIATAAPGNYDTIVSDGGVGYDTANTGPNNVVPPLDLAGADAENVVNYVTDLSMPVTLLDGPMPADQGRTGQFQVAVNFVSLISPFAPAGVYEAQLVYTAYESTTDEGGGVTPDPFDTEDNTASGATLLLPPDTETVTWGIQSLSATDTEDWFAIDLIAGETLNLSVVSTLGSLTATLCEDELCASPVSGNTPTMTKRYYIRVIEDTAGDGVYELQYDYTSQPADFYDPGDDTCAGAMPIMPTGIEQPHVLRTLSSTDTQDWFSFTSTAGALYNFNSIISNGITKIEMYDACGGALLFSDFSGGGSASTGSYFYLNVEDVPDQDYYLKVSSAIPNADATYAMYFSTGLTGVGQHSDDLFDHTPLGDDRGLATPTELAVTEETQSHNGHTLTPSDIADLYTFVGVSGNLYNFTSTNFYGDLTLEVLDSSFNILETSSNLSGAFNHDFTAPATDVFYLFVRNNDNASGLIAAYDLEYTDLGAGPAPDSNEPDNSGAEAALVVPFEDLSTDSPHSLTAVSDTEDWFAFDLTAGNEYTFATANNTVGDPICYLYSDIDGTVLENTPATDDNAGGGNNCQTVFTPLVTQRYYYRIVESAGGDATYSFTYQITVPYLAPDAQDPTDDTGLGATGLSPTTTPQTHPDHTLSATDIYDWYALNLTSGQEYTFSTTGDGDTTCDLYESIDGEGRGVNLLNDPSVDDDAGDSSNCLTTYTALATQTYYYRVHGYTLGSNIIYHFNYVENSGGDIYDPTDDTPSGATIIAPSTTPNSHPNHTLSATDNYDFFSATLTEDITYNFDTIGAASGDTYIEIYENVSAVIPDDKIAEDPGFDQTGGHANLNFTAPATATYYIAVRADTLGTAADYTLNYQEIPGGELDYYDPADDKAILIGANPIDLGTPTGFEQSNGPHTLSDNDLYDWYEFYLNSGVTYNFNAVGGSGDNYASLYSDAAGTTEVAFDDDAGGGLMFSLNYTPSVTGTYFLRVRKYAVAGSSSYALKYSSL